VIMTPARARRWRTENDRAGDVVAFGVTMTLCPAAVNTRAVVSAKRLERKRWS